jgi:cell division protein FtsW (lipid II flippase)
LKISILEKITLLLVSIILLIGYILFYTNVQNFEIYVREDGIVEWLTVVGLLAGCLVCLSRFVKLFKHKNWWFLTVILLLAILLFFVAGEEISWGQRILGIKSPEFFVEENSQHEMNFHNLVINGIKINKLVFSFGLIVMLAIYLGVMPILYYKNNKIKNFLNASGVPIPRLYQTISFVLLFIITSLLHHEKNSELLECGAALLFFLIVFAPKNKSIFQHQV